VGGEGFGFAPGPDLLEKIPQAGTVVIEDDVEIGSNSCVDRAAMGATRVQRGAKLDNLVQVGHAAQVGPGSCMVAYSGVAGSTRLGAGVTLAAKAAVLGHLQIGDGVQVGVASAVHDDQPAGARVTGVPAIDHRTWLRAATGFSELPDLIKRLRALEARVAELEDHQEES
jgi:UDP-3-O-[3-hydroxymyristoyl] glucosamine N-acyltransferase